MAVQNTWYGAATAAALAFSQFAYAGACTGTNCQAPNNTLALNSNGTEFRAADNFAFPNVDIITNVCWQGLYADLVSDPPLQCSDGTTDSFTIRFLNDGGGCFPSSEISSFTQGSTLLNVTRTDTGQTIGDFAIFEYTAELAGGAIIDGEVCNWVEITNAISSGNPNCSWFWVASDEGDGFRVQDITIADPYSADDIDNTGDLAFCFTTSFGSEIELPSCSCPLVASVCTTDAAACQLPDQNGTGSSAITFTTADNFVLPAATNITGACWWGSYRLGSDGSDCSANPPQPENFIIRIRSTTASFLPGTVLGEFRSDNGTLVNFQKVATTLETNDVPFSLDEYSFTADFATPLAVQGNTCLWIEIIGPEATPPTGCRFRWSNTGLGFDGVSFQDGDPINGYGADDTIGTDKAFCIKTSSNAALTETDGCFNVAPPPQCASGDTITASASSTLFAGGVACATGGTITTQNFFARTFNVGAAPFEVCSVDFGFTNSGPLLNGTMNLYVDTNGGNPTAPGVDLNLLGSTSIDLPQAGIGLLTATFNPPVCVAANTQLVVELDVPASPNPGGGFAVYVVNGFGESSPTFIRAADCGINNYVTLESLNFPNQHWVLAVCGDAGACDGQCKGGGDACPADIAPAAGGNCSADGDGTVGAGDLGELLANWGSPVNDCADLAPVGAGDGTVNAADLGELLANWGQCS